MATIAMRLRSLEGRDSLGDLFLLFTQPVDIFA
uniref:Uncharacterized protein n=1 Tax=mine drainage metagenome TaxID=410659 RepID=E6PFX1_9ZZZZ